MPELQVTLNVPGCPRCTNDHSNLQFNEFITFPLSPYEFYGQCPTTGEPLLKASSGITAPGLPSTTA